MQGSHVASQRTVFQHFQRRHSLFGRYEKAESLRRGDLLRLRGSPKPTDVTVDGRYSTLRFLKRTVRLSKYIRRSLDVTTQDLGPAPGVFLAAGLRFVGKCNGRGETGGPLLARWKGTTPHPLGPGDSWMARLP